MFKGSSKAMSSGFSSGMGGELSAFGFAARMGVKTIKKSENHH